MAEIKKQPRFRTVIANDLIEKVKQLVLVSRNIVITCHVSPDGDALGSSFALWYVLKGLGKTVNVVTADCAPSPSRSARTRSSHPSGRPRQ